MKENNKSKMVTYFVSDKEEVPLMVVLSKGPADTVWRKIGWNTD